ncbi:MAG: TonB-dependent receptor [Verrucomicrobiota bacterium]
MKIDLEKLGPGLMYFVCSSLFLFSSVIPLSADPVHALAEYVVTSRATNLIGETISASEGAFGQADLEYRPILRTGEVLEVIPGLIATQHSGTGKANQYFLRGFNLDHGTDFATFIDGMPVNMVTHAHGQGYTDINFLIPELIEVVNYTKGPYRAALGDFASAGSAQIETFDWLDRGIALFAIGEDSYVRGVLADGFQLGSGETLLLGAEAQYYDGPWDIGENLNQFKGLAKYQKQLENGLWTTAFHGYESSWDSADQIPLRAVQGGLITDLGSLDDDVGGESSRYSLSTEYWLQGEDTSTSINAYLIYYDLNLWSNFTYFLEDPVNGDEFEQAEDRLIYGANIAHTIDHGHLFGKHMRQTFGAQVRYDVIDDVGLYQTADRERLDTVREDDVRELGLGLFYENEIELADRLRSIFGLRGDYYYFDVDSDLDVNSGKEDDFILSPKLSLIYTLNNQLELYASAGLGFHSNDARGTTITVDPTDPTLTAPAESVDPLVRSTGAEVGFRFFWNDQLNSSVSLWWLELDSELLYVGDAGATEASIGSERYGLEIANYYRPFEWLTIDLDVSFTEAELENGDEIPGALETVANGGFTARHESGLFTTFRGRYFGPRPLTEDGSVESDSSLVFNFRVGYDFSENLRVAFDVLNLFDSDDDDITYFYESRLANEVAGVEDIHFHPIEPRTLRASVTYRF